MIDLNKIPQDIGCYIAGFCDGEASFNCSFRKRSDYSIPWKVSLCFNVSQKDKVILALIKKHLQCGALRSRPDGVWYFEVNNLTAITENVIPFFKKFQFLSAKKKNDFRQFQALAGLFESGKHLTTEGIIEILSIRNAIDDGGKRKYSNEEIMLELRKSSETTRQALT